jgi:hypothetical protein
MRVGNKQVLSLAKAVNVNHVTHFNLIGRVGQSNVLIVDVFFANTDSGVCTLLLAGNGRWMVSEISNDQNHSFKVAEKLNDI